jgi:hypothetical protein
MKRLFEISIFCFLAMILISCQKNDSWESKNTVSNLEATTFLDSVVTDADVSIPTTEWDAATSSTSEKNPSAATLSTQGSVLPISNSSDNPFSISTTEEETSSQKIPSYTVTTESESTSVYITTVTKITEESQKPLETQTSEPTLEETIPVLSIQTKRNQEITSKDTYLSATVSTDDTLAEYTFTNLSASIRCRGNYTYSSVPKKSYRLKFDEKINLFGQDEGKAKNWILLANYTDRTLLRNDIVFTMARKLNHIQEVTSSGFVRLYINGNYMGIYQLCEQHSISSHRIAINEQPEVIDSDYFIEMDAYASGTEGIDYFQVESKKFVVKNDQIHSEAISFLTDYFNQVNEAIRGGNQQEIEKLVDISSFVDMYILQEFVRNVDVGWSSFYMVKEAGGKLRLTWPWDFDLAFGNDERLGDAPFEGLYAGNDDYNSWSNSNPWFYRLMRRQWFVDLVIQRWNEIGKEITDAAIDRIDLLQEKWGDSVLKTNFDVWPILGTSFYPTPSSIARLKNYNSVIHQLRRWIQNRYVWLDDYFHDPTLCYSTVIE